MINIVEEFNRAKETKQRIKDALEEAIGKSGFLIAYHENFNIPKFSAWEYSKLETKRAMLFECDEENRFKAIFLGDYSHADAQTVIDALAEVFVRAR